MIDQFSLLIVDDEIDLVEMYKDFLESEGFNVLSAHSAEEALELISENSSIKLIISDSHMEKMSGLEFLSTIKNKLKKEIFFYLATGDITNSEAELKKLGVTRLVLKPFELDDLVVNIKTDLKI